MPLILGVALHRVFGTSARETNVPASVWRYYLLMNRPETSDSIFTWNEFVSRNNADLLNNLGNFVNRVRVLKFLSPSSCEADPSQLPILKYRFSNSLLPSSTPLFPDQKTAKEEISHPPRKRRISLSTKPSYRISTNCSLNTEPPWAQQSFESVY